MSARPLCKLQFELSAAELVPSHHHMFYASTGKQIFEDYANVYCKYIELFSHFPADTTMHPVLKNLGITDKVISFIMESVNGNKVKTNLLWRSDE